VHVVRPTRAIPAIGALFALALLASLVLAGPASAGQKGHTKGPSGNAFYDPPKKLPVSHGNLIWERKAKGLATIDGAASNTLVLYTSKTPRGKTAAVSGTVSIPKGKPPKSGWPVITYGHGTTGTADSCAPTRVSSKSPVADYVDYIDPQLEDWIHAGYVVVRSDYQGLGVPGPHPYLVGDAEGRSMLDLVSAAEQVEHRIGDRYLIAGHSQGGHAALFAAGEAASYLKKFDLRGTVSYAPGSHILEQAKLLDAFTQPSGLSALAALVIDGATTESADIKVPQLLNDEPLALFPQVGKKCLLQLGKPDSFGGIPPSEMLRDDADTGPLYDVLAAENPDVKTKAPVLIAQGTADTTAYKTFTDQLVDELKDAGDDVSYMVYDGVDHGGTPKAAEHDVLRFFKHQLPPKG
jgi:pimeloyl-ACP methyl ester carboxylesterase